MRGPASVKAGSRPPWLGLGAAAWVQVAGGASSTFALYSHALKVALGADQSRLALLGVACDVGENLGLLPGVLCNRLHPALLLLIGAGACLLGYGTAWLLVSGVAPALPYWLVSCRPPLSIFVLLVLLINLLTDFCFAKDISVRSLRSSLCVCETEVELL